MVCFPQKSLFCLLSLALRPSSANSISSSTSSNHSGYTPEPPLPPVGGDLASRLSSDEGEMDGTDESEKLLDCHFSTHHPRPLAVGLLLFPSGHFFLHVLCGVQGATSSDSTLPKQRPPGQCFLKGLSLRLSDCLRNPLENHRRKGKGTQLIIIL